MSNVERWTASMEFDFDPILTYTRRRDQYVEWVDENVQTEAFLHDDAVFGIAVGSLAQRLRIDEQSTRIELLDRSALALDLEDAFDGYLATVRPPNLGVASYRAAMSVPVEGRYDENRARLARRAVGEGAIGEDMIATDCACLVDFETESLAILIEFGVVSASELVDRLAGRVVGLLGRTHGRQLKGALPSEADLPGVSLYAEALVTPRHSIAAKSAFMAIETMSEIETKVGRLVCRLGENV